MKIKGPLAQKGGKILKGAQSEDSVSRTVSKRTKGEERERIGGGELASWEDFIGKGNKRV